MGPPDSHRISRVPRYSGYRYASKVFRVRGCHPLRRCFPASSTTLHLATTRSYNPSNAGTSLVWALPRSLATTGGIIVYFLFLEVLRCFSSLGSPPHYVDNRPSAYWVVPFGDPRVNGHLHLTGAYRSLSRPSSPVRAKASAMRPFLLSRTLKLPIIHINI